ncbi:MAG: hypothetical protein M1831_006359 [Alyxoria varia]|nr:MAG: hypothetical protein M1831_006359 [Alyxoria varia]
MAYSPESIVAVSILLPLLAVTTVSLRFFVRKKLARTYIGFDDWLLLAACFLALADGANLAVAAIIGFQGRVYEGTIPHQRAVVEARCDYVKTVIEKPLFGLIKLSVLLFYRRFFFIRQSFMVWNNIMIALITLWAVGFMLVQIFACGHHLEVFWTAGASHETCIDLTWSHLWFGITDVIGDIAVVVMPYPCIRKMRLQRREKLGVTTIFLLGTFSTAAAVVRLGFVCKAFTNNFAATENNHGSGTPPAVWSTIQAGVGIIAACLPALGPLIKPKRKRSTNSTSLPSGITLGEYAGISENHPLRPRQRTSDETLRMSPLSPPTPCFPRHETTSSSPVVRAGDIEEQADIIRRSAR